MTCVVLCLTQLRPLSIELRVPPFLPSRCAIWNFGFTTSRHSTSNQSVWPQCRKSLAFEFTFPLSLMIGNLLASCHTSLFFLSPPLSPWTPFYQSPVPQYCTSPPFTHWSLSQIPIFNNDHVILHNLCTDIYTLQEIKRWFCTKVIKTDKNSEVGFWSAFNPILLTGHHQVGPCLWVYLLLHL